MANGVAPPAHLALQPLLRLDHSDGHARSLVPRLRPGEAAPVCAAAADQAGEQQRQGRHLLPLRHQLPVHSIDDRPAELPSQLHQLLDAGRGAGGALLRRLPLRPVALLGDAHLMGRC